MTSYACRVCYKYGFDITVPEKNSIYMHKFTCSLYKTGSKRHIIPHHIFSIVMSHRVKSYHVIMHYAIVKHIIAHYLSPWSHQQWSQKDVYTESTVRLHLVYFYLFDKCFKPFIESRGPTTISYWCLKRNPALKSLLWHYMSFASLQFENGKWVKVGNGYFETL
jgi:hypothetical protein